ncbi:MAG: flagellar motor switch protein FliM [Gammaproteobacteria bacterium]
MASVDLLTQDEIDALLHGVDSGKVDTDAEHALDGVARPFDLTGQDSISRGRMPTLEKINERFAHYFRISLFNMLRRSSAKVSFNSVQIMQYCEYMHSLSVPTSINLIKISPLRGKALCVIDPRLVFFAVDNYLGGTGRQAWIEAREFSPTEARVIQIILTQAFKDLQQAWHPILPVNVEFHSTEVNPHLASIASPNELVAVCSFYIELDGGGGTFSVVMPKAMLEPVRELLNTDVQSARTESDDHWRLALQEEVKTAEVTLSCTLAKANMRLGDLLSLKEGDIIPINSPDKITVVADDVPLFRATYDVHDGSETVKIQEKIHRSQNSEETHAP